MTNERETWLSTGAHHSPEEGICFMELVSMLAGEPFSDSPECASPVLASFGRSLNDCLSDNLRQSLRPLAARTLGTANDGQDEARVWMARDWILRRYVPSWLNLAGLTEYAEKLSNHDALLSEADLEAIMPTLSAARSATLSAARSATLSAARSATLSAATLSTARSTAWSAAWSAAESTAESAARALLAPTVEALQAQTVELFEQMLDPGELRATPPDLIESERGRRGA